MGFEVHRTEGFTVMSNHHLRDKELSFKAKGLLSFMFSLPPNWDYSIRGLAAVSKDGIDGIGATLKELETAGYLVRERIRRAKGRMGEMKYHIYETPQNVSPKRENPDQVKPDQVKPDMEKPDQENPAQINKDGTITDLINTDLINTDGNMGKPARPSKKQKDEPVKHKYGEYKNVLLSDTDMEKLKTEFPGDWQERIERLSAYMESKGAKYKNHLATIRNWARRDREEKQAKQQGQASGFVGVDKSIDDIEF